MSQSYRFLLSLVCGALTGGSLEVSASDLPAKLSMMSHVWAPYQILENGKIGGLTGRIGRCALDALDIPYTVDVVPVSRAQESVRLGKADGWFVARESERRNSFAVRTNEHVASVQIAVVTKQGSQYDPSDPDFLKKSVIGTVRGTGSFDQLSKINPQPVAAKTESQLVDLLRKDRVDGIFYTYLPVKFLLESYQVKFKIHIVQKTYNYIYFNKEIVSKFPNLIPKIDQYLPKCRKKERI